MYKAKSYWAKYLHSSSFPSKESNARWLVLIFTISNLAPLEGVFFFSLPVNEWMDNKIFHCSPSTNAIPS